MTRQTKTPRQRAQEALEVETRKRTRLRKKVDTMRAELAVLERDLAAIDTRVEYLAQSPDLPAAARLEHTTTEGDNAA